MGYRRIRVGDRFGRLVVVEKAPRLGGSRLTAYVCLCDCGESHVAVGGMLARGDTKSCGCLARDLSRARQLKHGLSEHPLYQVWGSMKRRCGNKKDAAFKNYGARGISVCKEWANSFELFHQWAMEHGYSPGLHIDRINNDGNYEPNNCRFITQGMNNRNSRRAKLRPSAVEQIRKFLSLGFPQILLAKRFHVSRSAISNVARGRTWGDLGRNAEVNL